MLHYNLLKGRQFIWEEGAFHTRDVIYGQYAGRPWKLAPLSQMRICLSYEPS